VPHQHRCTTEVMHHLTRDRRVAMAGDGAELRTMARAARDLKNGRGATHYELFLFKTWEELREYAEPQGASCAYTCMTGSKGHDVSAGISAQVISPW